MAQLWHVVAMLHRSERCGTDMGITSFVNTKQIQHTSGGKIMENPVHSDGEKTVHKRLLAQLPVLLPVSKAKTGPEFYSPTGRCYLCAAEGYP